MAKKKSKTVRWTIRAAGCVEASVHGPYDSEKAQDAGMTDFAQELDSNTDAVIKIIIDSRGRLDAVALSTEEMEEVVFREDPDEDEEDEEDIPY